MILDLSKAISQKRCKIGGKLLLITNRKSHMSFRLVPNSVTLNDLEPRNRPNDCVISLNSVAFGADCVIVGTICPSYSSITAASLTSEHYINLPDAICDC